MEVPQRGQGRNPRGRGKVWTMSERAIAVRTAAEVHVYGRLVKMKR